MVRADGEPGAASPSVQETHDPLFWPIRVQFVENQDTLLELKVIDEADPAIEIGVLPITQ